MNLLEYHALDEEYHKLSSDKKIKNELSSFLPFLPGYNDTPAVEDGSSLQQLYENPPRVRKELDQLPSHVLSGFRLAPGPVSAVMCKRIYKLYFGQSCRNFCLSCPNSFTFWMSIS